MLLWMEKYPGYLRNMWLSMVNWSSVFPVVDIGYTLMTTENLINTGQFVFHPECLAQETGKRQSVSLHSCGNRDPVFESLPLGSNHAKPCTSCIPMCKDKVCISLSSEYMWAEWSSTALEFLQCIEGLWQCRLTEYFKLGSKSAVIYIIWHWQMKWSNIGNRCNTASSSILQYFGNQRATSCCLSRQRDCSLYWSSQSQHIRFDYTLISVN